MVFTALEVVVESCVYSGVDGAVTEGDVSGCVLEYRVPRRQLKKHTKNLFVTVNANFSQFFFVKTKVGFFSRISSGTRAG